MIPFSLLEAAEADSWAEIQRHVSPQLKRRFDVEVNRIAGVVVITAPKTDMLAVNRAWLPGRDDTASGETVAAIADHARSRGIPQLLLHMPAWAHGTGLTIEGWQSVTPLTKFYQAAVPRPYNSRLRIVAVGTEHGELFGEIAALGNEAPPFMADGFNSTLGRPGWRHYLAFDESTPISAAGGPLSSEGRVVLLRRDFAGASRQRRAARAPGTANQRRRHSWLFLGDL
jgi:hypothetical protein